MTALMIVMVVALMTTMMMIALMTVMLIMVMVVMTAWTEKLKGIVEKNSLKCGCPEDS